MLVVLVGVSACGRAHEAAQAAPEGEKPAVQHRPAVSSVAFWQAIVSGQSDTVADGLSQGISANLATTEGVSALMLAASTGSEQAVEALLSHGARSNDWTKEHHLTPLMFAAYECSRPVSDILIAGGADPKLNDSDGGSAADWAFRGCNDPKDAASLMEYLHANGAGVQPRGDAVGLLLAEAAPPPIESLLKAARSHVPAP